MFHNVIFIFSRRKYVIVVKDTKQNQDYGNIKYPVKNIMIRTKL